MMAGSSLRRSSSAWGRPIPQALIGFDRSVQLMVSWLQDVVENPRIPMPERMFQVATLNVLGAAAAGAPPTGPGEAGEAGVLASEPPHAPATTTNARAITDRRKCRSKVTPSLYSKIPSI